METNHLHHETWKDFHDNIQPYDEWKHQWILINCDLFSKHSYEYVYKMSESGRILLYEQCQSCGMRKSTSTLKHETVPNLKYKIQTNQIKKFSQELEDNGPTRERYYNEYYNIERHKYNNKKQEEYQQKQEDYKLQSQQRKRLWFNEHNEYLQTSQWKNIRQKVLKRDNFLCQGCLENRATEVHHLTYDNWKNELMFELISVCFDCHHNKIHKK